MISKTQLGKMITDDLPQASEMILKASELGAHLSQKYVLNSIAMFGQCCPPPPLRQKLPLLPCVIVITPTPRLL